MKTNFKLTRLVVALLLLPGLFSATKVYADDYKKYAQQLREDVWGWERPEFSNYEIPAEYKNESAVILALHEEIIATGKSKIRFDPNLLLALNKELSYSQIYRKLIHINDKSSLEEYSELSFIEEQSSYGFRVSTKNKYVVGARIIKPDGTIREVDMDEAVSITEGKKNEESHKKLAVPDLQVGDILDYFFYEEGRVDYQNIPPRDFYFASSYPILSYTVHCEIDKKLTTEYRSVNGAPDFEVTNNENGDIIMDLRGTNLPKIESKRWLSPLRQFPTARLAVYYNSSKNIFKPGSHRGKGVYKDVDPDLILHDAMGYFAGASFYMIQKDLTKKAKKHFKKHPEMDNKAKADYLNASLRDAASGFNSIRYNVYLHTLHKLLNNFKIENKVGIVTSRFDAPYNEATVFWDFNAVITANNDTQVYTAPNSRFYAGNTSNGEGETIYTVSVKKLDSQSKEGIKGVYGEAKFPVSTSDDNMSKTLVNVELSADNPLTLIIDEESRLTGHHRNGFYGNYIYRFEWDREMSRYLDNETYIETLEKKNKQKDIEAYRAQIEKAEKERKESVKEEIKESYGQEPKELIECNFVKFGVAPDDSEMLFKTKYSIDGLVKRAGNNYILDAGKLMGKQLVLDDKERNREIDAYFPYARTYRYEIQVNIPDGYTLEGMDKLNMSVDNRYGKFVSKASQKGNVLSIDVEKTYKTNYVPTSGWNSLLEMLDSANNFYAQSVILRKI